MKKYLILFFVAAAAAFQSCDNNDDLWDAIDDLKSRVSALETQVDALNGNIEAMQTLYNGGATVSEVMESDGAYVIKLTDGTTLTLTQGSEAEAVIPVVSIDANGNWQYSVDGGKSFISLGQNAVAEDGVTPQFRIDESTGCWQVNTTGEESGWTNVKDSAGKDVSAVGGDVADKFFDSVRVDGDTLYIKLLGSDVELEVPIVADVLCAIVDAEGNPIEGIQMFDSGVERSFNVQMRGIDNTIVTAPEGWTARLTAPVDEVATLFVKAPGTQASAGTTATRATANTSQDVAILATSGKYSFISKIQVQSTGVEAEPPTVTSVTSSVATDVTLMFDVQIANADGWKYICLESGSEAPDAAKVFAEGTAVLGTSVTVEGLKAETEYTIYVVAYIGEQYSEVSTATASTMKAVPTEIDYYYNYQEGIDVTIGDLVVNKATYPDAKLLKPSEITADVLKAGGLIFVDNSDTDNLAQTVEGTSLRVGQTATGDITILIGRYAERAQAELTLPEVRCEKNVAFKNLCLSINAGVSYNFTTSNAAIDPSLYIVDCTIEGMGRYMIYDVNPSKCFKKIFLDNSIVKYPTLTNQPSVYAMQTATSGESAKTSFAQENFTFTNNVFYHDAPLQAHVINLGSNNAFFQTTRLSVTVTGNTLYNLYQPNVLIRAYVLSSLDVSRNVGYYVGFNAKNYLTAVYDKTNFTVDKATVSYNYLYTTPVEDGVNFWSVVHTGSYKGANNSTGADLEVPFSKMDTSNGYFPINTSVVTTGAGATYDTKLWKTFE